MTTNQNDIRNIRPNGITPQKIARVINGEVKEINEIRKIINNSPVVVWKIGEPEPPEPVSTITIFDMISAYSSYDGRYYAAINALEAKGESHTGTIKWDNEEPIAYDSSRSSAAIDETENSHHVEIDCPMTYIEPSSVSSQCFYKQKFTYIKFADTIKTIGSYAFRDCQLKNCEVDFSKVETIKENVFAGATFSRSYSQNVIINARNVKYIESLAFISSETTYTTSIIEAHLENCEYLGNSAFSRQGSLENVYFEKIKQIGYRVFYYNLTMTEIEIPETIETIDTNAFEGMTKLKTIKIHKPAGTVDGYETKWGATSANIIWLG